MLSLRTRDLIEDFAPLLAFGLIIAAIPGLVWLTGATFGQRCDALHPGADKRVLARCVYDLGHPIEAAKSEAYQQGYRDGVAIFARMLGVEQE